MNTKTHSVKFSKWICLCSVMTAILFGSVTTSWARLGETNTEITKRYGPVIARQTMDTNTWMAFYSFKEYRVGVIFKNNRSVWEIVTPVEKREFAVDEVAALLKNIGGSSKWVKSPKTHLLKQHWSNSEIRAEAELENKFMGASDLTVMSLEFLVAEAEKNKVTDAKKADGF